MSKINFCTLLFFFIFQALFSQNNVEKEVLKAQQERFAAMVNSNFEKLDLLLADDLTYGHTTGLTESKEDLLKSIRSNKFDYVSFISRNTKIKTYQNIATISCIADVKLLLKNGPLNLTIKILEVHKKVDKHWLLTSYQSVRYPKN